jgi:hypothetical protein
VFIEEDDLGALPVINDLSKLEHINRSSMSIPNPSPIPRNVLETAAYRTESITDYASSSRAVRAGISHSIISGYLPSDIGNLSRDPFGHIAGRSLAGIPDEEASILGIAASIVSEPLTQFPGVASVGKHMEDIEVHLTDRSRRKSTWTGSLSTVPNIQIRASSPEMIPQSPSTPSVLDIGTTSTPVPSGHHLIVFVHGLLGSSFDLRQYRNRVQTALHLFDLGGEHSDHVYLISSVNEDDTFDDIEVLADKLVDEILTFIAENDISVERMR